VPYLQRRPNPRSGSNSGWLPPASPGEPRPPPDPLACLCLKGSSPPRIWPVDILGWPTSLAARPTVFCGWARPSTSTTDAYRLQWVEGRQTFSRGGEGASVALIHVPLLLGCAVAIYLACEWFVNAVE